MKKNHPTRKVVSYKKCGSSAAAFVAQLLSHRGNTMHQLLGLPCVTFSFGFAVNCMYWEQRFPRLLTSKELLNLRRTGRSRLLVIADITCDRGGSIEFVKEYSSISYPFLRFVHWITLQNVRFYLFTMSNEFQSPINDRCVIIHVFGFFC